MKKTVALLLCLALGMVNLTGCAGDNETFAQKRYTAEADQITEVCIDAQDRQIEVTLSADNKIHIDYFENSKEYYDISVSNNSLLTMTAASNKEWTDYIGIRSASGSRKILLQLPDELLTSLKLSTSNEDILLPSLTVDGELSLSSYGGNIAFDKLDVKNAISLNAKNGNISGTIIGNYDDYAISCDIKKGESNLPSSKENGTKSLMVSNNNGDIDVKFVKE